VAKALMIFFWRFWIFWSVSLSAFFNFGQYYDVLILLRIWTVGIEWLFAVAGFSGFTMVLLLMLFLLFLRFLFFLLSFLFVFFPLFLFFLLCLLLRNESSRLPHMLCFVCFEMCFSWFSIACFVLG
jgi:hypothetical protein